ncbi:hypothetical protein HY407_02155, partial [Candidatus Gottesmanbacteria bacterium]|nr:hypothetical protein [Candidatus Gottesmanbacteria bacterium]
GNMPLALVFFPDNKLTKHYSDWGIYHDKTYPGYRDEKLNRIALEKPIVIVTGYHFGDRKKYARLLDYKIIYEDNLHDNEHAVLIPR